MRSNIKRKNYNLILVLIFVFNLVTQAAIPAVVYATEVDDTDINVTEVTAVEDDTEAIDQDDIDEELIESIEPVEVDEELPSEDTTETEVEKEPEIVPHVDTAAEVEPEIALQAENNLPLDLPIMHINDTHGNVQKLAFMVDEIDKYRAANDNAILLHAGDAFTGTLYFNQFRGQADLEILNLMGVDAMIFGNHEFDFGNTGHTDLAEFVKKADFPFIASNVNFEGNTALRDFETNESMVENPENGKIYDSIILDVDDGQKVGVFGVTTEDTINIASPVDITFSNYIKAAEEAVAEFEAEGIDKIIALTHIGYASNPNVGNDRVLAQTVAGIDVIVGGHSHTALDTPVEITNAKSDGPTVIVQTGGNAGTLGTLNVSFDENGVVKNHTRKLISIKDRVEDGGVLASRVAAVYGSLKSGVDELANTPIDAVATTDLTNPRFNDTNTTNSVRANETALGNLVTDAMLYKAKEKFPDVQIAFQNSGGIRAPIAAGPITLGQIYQVLPFGNNPVVLTLSGSELKEIMEHALRSAPGESGGFLQISGMKVIFDSEREPSNRVVKMYVVENDDLTEIDMNTVYSVTTNAYTASGGDGFKTLENAYNDGRVIDFGENDWEQFKNHLEDLQGRDGEINPVIEGRIVDLKGETLAPEELTLTTQVPNSDFIVTVTGEGLEGLRIVATLATNSTDNVPAVLGTNYDLFNISLVDVDGNKVQPEEPVLVTISLKDGVTPEKVFHFGDNFEIEEKLDFEVIDGDIAFITDSFSYFGIQYAAVPGETDSGDTEDTETPGDPDSEEITEDLPQAGTSIIVPLIGGTTLILSGLGTELYRRKRFMK